MQLRGILFLIMTFVLNNVFVTNEQFLFPV